MARGQAGQAGSRRATSRRSRISCRRTGVGCTVTLGPLGPARLRSPNPATHSGQEPPRRFSRSNSSSLICGVRLSRPLLSQAMHRTATASRPANRQGVQSETSATAEAARRAHSRGRNRPITPSGSSVAALGPSTRRVPLGRESLESGRSPRMRKHSQGASGCPYAITFATDLKH